MESQKITFVGYLRIIKEFSVGEIKGRYKQSILGVSWAFAKPLSMALVFTFLFESVSKLSTGPIPYFIYVLIGVLSWDFFATIINNATNSMIKNRQILERFNHPKSWFLIVSVLVAGFDFLVGLIIFFVMFLASGLSFSSSLIFLPIFALYIILAALSISFWSAVAAVWFRDLRFIVQYSLQILMLVSPIGFAPENLPKDLSMINFLNPVLPAIELMRWSVFGSDVQSHEAILLSFFVMLCVLISGMITFRSLESKFLDVL